MITAALVLMLSGASFEPPARDVSAARLLEVEASIVGARSVRASYGFQITSIVVGSIVVAAGGPAVWLYAGLTYALIAVVPGLVLLGTGIGALVSASSQNRSADEYAESLEREKQALLSRLVVNARREF